jgi:hypothetical protein
MQAGDGKGVDEDNADILLAATNTKKHKRLQSILIASL